MSLFHRSRALWVAVLAIVLAMVVAACGDTKDDTESNASSTPAASSTDGGAAANADGEYRRGLKAIVMPKQLGNPYEELEDSGTVEAFSELGGEATIEGPTDAGASSQVPLLQSAIQKQPDAIILAANDPNAVAPVLKRAIAGDIRVVTQDSDAAPDARQIFINQATTEGIGEVLARMSKAVVPGGRGEIAVLSATANATNQNAWIRVLQERLKTPEYSGLRLVKVAYGDDDDQKSFQEAQGLLSAYPNLRAIVAPTTVGIAAAARYLSTSPKKGRVAVTGLGTPNQMRKFVKDGTSPVFALWNPKDVGYLGGYAAAALASGIITGAEGERFEAGRLGEREILANGEIVLGPPTEFTRDNIDDFRF
ncbi:rhamnose ABC transporter substrate-binding protein [Conexibacter sp. JD483]|uniref:rhamnose ABC transporter substrate-binding protein n=1 Tax=unclassified Conexibacter TaxID=2627773 RepID=UPI002723CDA0|nr:MULTISPECIES: rhamnose ABC transporter substrate-binding protein [unclassified Conexibacter]MDO8184963.1 rhamnose ABC transporter substrate-binding protein [Conexibacter sp. CPCC 205706]MDO8198107.1 rhamnose ABC transporter substrate-binding protein [Conexibacter sp. CPCC 205762]MDR9368271.1 rhamnose ABC transporter substrate-binding protein [Conexibacter sp. JD483]